MRSDNRRFKHGTFTCVCCGKLTRDTGIGEGSLRHCAFCQLMGELQNTYTDGGCSYDEYINGVEYYQKKYKRTDNPNKTIWIDEIAKGRGER